MSERKQSNLIQANEQTDIAQALTEAVTECHISFGSHFALELVNIFLLCMRRKPYVVLTLHVHVLDTFTCMRRKPYVVLTLHVHVLDTFTCMPRKPYVVLTCDGHFYVRAP